MSIKMKDVLDAIDHRSRQVHEGEMGLWVRVSEWEMVREAMRHSPSEVPDAPPGYRHELVKIGGASPPDAEQRKRGTMMSDTPMTDEHFKDTDIGPDGKPGWIPKGAEHIQFCKKLEIRGNLLAAAAKVLNEEIGALYELDDLFGKFDDAQPADLVLHLTIEQHDFWCAVGEHFRKRSASTLDTTVREER